MTRTYTTAYQGNPLGAYFSAEDGSYMTRWLVNDLITEAFTEVYMNAPVWYPNGFKWVFAHPKNGNEMDGVELSTSTDGHYLTF